VSSLRKRAFAGAIELSSTMALLMFVPAGSLRFWQARLYWTLFSGSVLAITLYFIRHDPALIERRLAAGPRAESRTSQKIIQFVATILFFSLMIIPGLDHRFHWSAVPVPVVLVANALCVLAMASIALIFQHNSYAAATIRTETGQQVISSGPYRFVRHPMYTGGALLLLATPFALGSVYALGASVLLIGAIIVRLLDEERYLSANLPAYANYCHKVRYRLVPLIW
jgi:protein-S-isoprenylcysteine O-methyltransferase Ste14